MKHRAHHAGARWLVSSAMVGTVAAGCGGVLPCARLDVATAAATATASEPPGSPATACVPDDCSLATLRAMTATELQAALAGRERATEPAVSAVADRMANDFPEDQANLDAL